MAHWIWDPRKAVANCRKHSVSFELAARVLNDPWQASRLDPYAGEERWQTIGRPSSESAVLLIVIHTALLPTANGDEVGRIISARKATLRERRDYEEGKF